MPDLNERYFAPDGIQFFKCITQECMKDIVIWTTSHLPTQATIVETNGEDYQFVDKYVMCEGEEGCNDWCWGVYD
jgi:hypothetical protein